MATPIFDHVYSKISEITFRFPEFAPAISLICSGDIVY